MLFISKYCILFQVSTGVSSGQGVSLCYGCGGHIQDRFYLLALDKKWHTGCLRCGTCKIPLDAPKTLFTKYGQIFCKEDYHRSVLAYFFLVLFYSGFFFSVLVYFFSFCKEDYHRSVLFLFLITPIIFMNNTTSIAAQNMIDKSAKMCSHISIII